MNYIAWAQAVGVGVAVMHMPSTFTSYVGCTILGAVSYSVHMFLVKE